MKLGKLDIFRDTFTKRASLGKLYIDEGYFCHTLEDVSRGENVKIPKETSLPTGLYKVILTYSSRFKRIMPMIFTELNGYQVINKGTSFKGSRLHGGNTEDNTESCPLVAHNRDGDTAIWGSAERELTARLKEMGLKEQKLPLKKDKFDYVALEIHNHAKF